MGYDTLTNVRKTNPGKTSQKTPDDTLSVTNLATQPEKPPGDTARKQPGDTARKQPGDTARKQPGDTARKQPGDTASNKPGDTARKPPVLDLAGWQHTMGWRPPSPRIGDRMAPLHKLTSLHTRS